MNVDDDEDYSGTLLIVPMVAAAAAVVVVDETLSERVGERAMIAKPLSTLGQGSTTTGRTHAS